MKGYTYLVGPKEDNNFVLNSNKYNCNCAKNYQYTDVKAKYLFTTYSVKGRHPPKYTFTVQDF